MTQLRFDHASYLVVGIIRMGYQEINESVAHIKVVYLRLLNEFDSFTDSVPASLNNFSQFLYVEECMFDK